MGKRVLVLCATSNTGRNVCRALTEAGFSVFGTTRGSSDLPHGNAVQADYTQQADLERAFKACTPDFVFGMVDYFNAAAKNPQRCRQIGEAIVQALERSQVQHVVWCSVGWGRGAPAAVTHFHALEAVAERVRTSTLSSWSIIEPAAYFENLDDPANWNPLKLDRVKMITEARIKWCSTYDVGRVAAAHFLEPAAFAGKSAELATWEGDLSDLAAAMQAASGHKTVGKLAMPKIFRKLLLGCLHDMCLFFEAGGALTSPGYDIEACRRLNPDAFSAEDWFRYQLGNRGLL
jgi:uncharacterized protein YbjT (DUF2867 family)